ncbi:hypothetical protein [Pedobacter frigoris]|uniref:Uncharacterized protein n=1 Tax=Pedobacter frigoris TaxID=2571272 RepID=A0A4U1CCN7_9SPHI|nr:hypothetical protein [Pedobacter frigoris]TKC03712.1 hypothetical protein FA047_19310 [Pedobacter frigoris]
MGYHNLANASASLFIHFDKSIYSNNETVWFTGYFLNTTPEQLKSNEILSLALIRDIDSAIIKWDKYLITGGLSFGSMALPDSMLAGDYHFQATTNKVSKGIPDIVFTQRIIIKTNIDPTFNAGVKLLKEGGIGKAPHQAVLSVLTRDARFLPKPVDVTYKYGTIVKRGKTNASGELVMDVPEQENISDPNLYIKVKYGKDSSFLNLTLPVTKRKASVGFYPESGNLIQNMPSIVAWEVKDNQLALVTTKALLYKNDDVIDTIETNSYGIGKFILLPEKDCTYKVKLLHSAFTDSIYKLPNPLEKGLSISIVNAAATDTLTMRVINTVPQNAALRIHNFKETFLYDELDFTTTHKLLRIPLNEVPKGLNTITISDSLGRPLAERIFFAHYNPEPKITLATDKSVYGQREKVTLKISLRQPDTLGFLSIACVQENRLSPKLSSDIERYGYLENQLRNLPVSLNGNGYSDKNYMEDILLVKGWRRYTWQDVLNTKSADTLKIYDPIGLTLNVKKNDKEIKAPVDITILGGQELDIKKTDNVGQLALDTKDLLIEAGGKMQAIVLGKNQSIYSIKANDPYINLNKRYLKSLSVEKTEIPSNVQNNSELALKSNEKILRLKEVKITSGTDNTLYKRGANPCGDYVCRNNILNCMNHISDPSNTHPIKGRTYMNHGFPTMYKGCDPEDLRSFITKLNPVYTKREFYVDSHSDPIEPAFVSTLFWSHGTVLSNKDKEIVFYTGDIVGKFRIVVQGVTETDVAHGAYSFEVKGK